MNVQPGDLFCVHGNMWGVSSVIRTAERFWSKDNEATYGHSGIITSTAGDTLEALWKVEPGHLENYRGMPMIIARPTHTLDDKEISLSDKLTAIAAIKAEHLGQWYPVPRLFLHVLPPVAKYIGTGKRGVCSELTAKCAWLMDARGEPWLGATPDMLADEWRRWKNFEFEEILP